MGICSSCLGEGRRRESYDDEEESPLFDDPSSLQYGSFGEQNVTNPDDDMEAQREIEALQRVVAKTSDNMVDIFEVAPQGDGRRRSTPAPFAYAGQEARIMRYKNLLSKLGANNAGEDVDPADGVQVDWLTEEQDLIEMQRNAPNTKTDDDKPLVGTFADAAAAMS